MKKIILDTKVLETKLEDLGLSVRAYNCLKRAGYNTIEDLVAELDEKNITNVRNLGKQGVDEVLAKLKSLGVDLNDEILTVKMLKLHLKNINGHKFLQSLPAKYFVKGSPEMAVIAEAIAQCLQDDIELLSKALVFTEGVTEKDYEKARKDIMEDIDTYKKIIDERRARYEKEAAAENFAGGMLAKVDEIRRYHHKTQQKQHEGHDHNPFIKGNDL